MQCPINQSLSNLKSLQSIWFAETNCTAFLLRGKSWIHFHKRQLQLHNWSLSWGPAQICRDRQRGDHKYNCMSQLYTPHVGQWGFSYGLALSNQAGSSRPFLKIPQFSAFDSSDLLCIVTLSLHLLFSISPLNWIWQWWQSVTAAQPKVTKCIVLCCRHRNCGKWKNPSRSCLQIGLGNPWYNALQSTKTKREHSQNIGPFVWTFSFVLPYNAKTPPEQFLASI